MKKIAALFLITAILAGCSSTKKLLRNGNYDAIIQKCVKSLIKNPDKEEDAALLDKAYNLANERDQDRIKYLKTENDPASFDEIFGLYSSLKNRQATVKKVMPLKFNGRSVQYPTVNYDNLMVEAKKKAANYYYDNATALMKNDTKESYRQAYYEFLRAKEYMASAFPGIDNQISDARYLGISRILLSVDNKTLFKLPDEFISNITALDSRELSNEWIEFHVRQVDNKTQYDYYADLVLQMIIISPDMTSQKDYVEKKTIEDGFSYAYDARGNVMKDSSGNDIKIKKFKDISCTIIETMQQKECTIKGEMELLSVYPKQLLNKVPVAATTHFEHLSARAIGDLNALKPETKRIIQVKPVPFPDDFGMIYDCTETLKLSIQDAIKSNRTFIK